MGKFLRWLGIAVALLVGAVLIALAYIYFASGRVLSRSYDPAVENLPRPTAAQLADAPRQARILGCVTCHGEGLKGNLMFEAPGVAAIWAPNLTQIAAGATDQQLAAGIRQGIGHDGRGLFVMPSGLYSRLSDGEVAALIAFIRSQPKDAKTTPNVSFGPLGRLGIVKGDLKPQPDRVELFRTGWPHELGPRYAEGRRLAATVCAECHAPDLSGWTMEDGNKTPDLSIVGAYDFEQFKTLMRTGQPPSGRDLGLMKTIAQNDTAHFTDEEIRALHDYLKTRAERRTQ